MKIRLFTIPNVITLCNLLCGCGAVVFALRFFDLRAAFWLIIAAAVFDFLDGFTARLLKSYSAVGKELDSLADMVSFGVAPSAIFYVMYSAAGGTGAWGFCAFILAAFSALRLAKFNIDETQSDEFEGLPTPAAAIFAASAGYLFVNGVYGIQPYYILITAVCLSYFLVSPVRMFALKFHGYGLNDPQNQLRYGFLLLSALALIFFWIKAIPFIIMGYILTSLVRNIAIGFRR